MNREIFQSGWSGYYSWPCVSTWLTPDFNLFWWEFLQPQVVSSMLVLISWKLRRDSLQISGVLSVQLPSLWSSVLWILAASFFLLSQLCLLHSGGLPGFSLSAPQPGNFFSGNSWGSCSNDRAFLVCFPSLRVHCLLLPHAPCLENHCFVHTFCLLCGCFRQRGESYLWKSILATSGSLWNYTLVGN